LFTFCGGCGGLESLFHIAEKICPSFCGGCGGSFCVAGKICHLFLADVAEEKQLFKLMREILVLKNRKGQIYVPGGDDR
jgi:hypothetical protein